MSELLIELFSEEIPARMQGAAAQGFERLVGERLMEAGLAYSASQAFVTPRRITLVIEGLPERQADTKEERKGPRTSAPEAAIEGFLKSTGLAREALKIQKDPKGDFYLAVLERKGRPTAQVLAEIVPAAMRALAWPKSMRPGFGDLVWVRPLHSILCVFAGEIVPFEIGGIRSGDETLGHRFMSEGKIRARSFKAYEAALRSAHVILSADERRALIATEARAIAEREGLTFIEDEALLEEVAGLAEWPVVLKGAFDKAFLAVPAEILISTMRSNQKYFPLYTAQSGARLASTFLLVANLEAADGGKAIIAGNERVLRARLSDAKFFWEQDLKTPLADRLPALEGIVFHAKLGSQGARARRIETLAGAIAEAIGADIAAARLAARLAKADLVTGTVGEFPEVQGIIGGHLAAAESLGARVAGAVREHYNPKGPSDDVPSSPEAMAVALADKIDTLSGFWAIGETPTGSRDPFALRRAALGVIRILLEGRLRLGLGQLIHYALHLHGTDHAGHGPVIESCISFIADRLKVYLRDRGARHDLVDAVFALGNQDELVALTERIAALGRFLGTDDGRNLLAGYKRAVNILRIEEKKDKRQFAGLPDPELLRDPAEQGLFRVLAEAKDLIAAELERERFDEAMTVLSRLRRPVDAFFETVTVNAAESEMRENRLKLLGEIRTAMHTIADFSRVEGLS